MAFTFYWRQPQPKEGFGGQFSDKPDCALAVDLKTANIFNYTNTGDTPPTTRPLELFGYDSDTVVHLRSLDGQVPRYRVGESIGEERGLTQDQAQRLRAICNHFGVEAPPVSGLASPAKGRPQSLGEPQVQA